MKSARAVRLARKASYQRGFTLVEMLIVVVLIGVLASIAYPAYTEQVRKSRRAEAQAVLMEASQFMERFLTENNRYDQNLLGVAVVLPVGLRTSPRSGGTATYNVSLQAVAQQSYTLQAVPAAAQTGDRCGTMTITNTGNRTAAAGDCWRR
jgi:type IV pilus assembly protein PilE